MSGRRKLAVVAIPHQSPLRTSGTTEAALYQRDDGSFGPPDVFKVWPQPSPLCTSGMTLAFATANPVTPLPQWSPLGRSGTITSWVQGRVHPGPPDGHFHSLHATLHTMIVNRCPAAPGAAGHRGTDAYRRRWLHLVSSYPSIAWPSWANFWVYSTGTTPSGVAGRCGSWYWSPRLENTAMM